MPGVLIVLVEAAILAALGVDLGRDFDLLTPGARLALAGIALLVLVPYFWRPVRRLVARPLRGTSVALAMTAALLAVLGSAEEYGSRRMLARWESGAAERLQSRATLLESDFAWLLDQIARPVGERLPEAGRPGAAFAILERAHHRTPLPPARFGLALYTAEGEPVAWTGNSTLAPPDLLAAAGPDPVFQVGGGEEAPRLYAVTVDGFSGLRRVAEILLRPPAMAGPPESEGLATLEFLPRWNAIQPAGIDVRLARGGSHDMARLFERQGDRHWWRIGRQSLLTLSVPLRSPKGEDLMFASLADRRAGEELTERRVVARRLGALLLAAGILMAALQAARSHDFPRWMRFALGAGTVVAVRIILMLVGPVDALPPLPIYDITLYASAAWGGLLRSPADLLLTAATALTLVWMAREWLLGCRIPERAVPRRLLRILLGLAMVTSLVAGGLALHRFLDRLVVESRLDLSRVEFDAHLVPRVALQGGVFLMVAAVALLVQTLFELTRRCRPAHLIARRLGDDRPDRVPPLLRGGVAVLLLTLLYVPFLQHAYDRLRQAFFENDLLPRVLYQSERRVEILRQALRATGEPDFAVTAGFDDDPPGDKDHPSSGLAYRLWGRTPLAEMGLASSLRVYDEDGRILSRFAVNVGSMLEAPFWQAREAAEAGPVPMPPRPGLTIKKGVVFGSRWVQAPRQAPRLVVLTVIDDYDNVPLLGAETSYLPLLRSRALSRTNPELLRFEPQMAVFGAGLERLYESGGEIPAPSVATRAVLAHQPSFWTHDDVGEGQARILYFRGPAEIFALAYPRKELLGSLAEVLRLFLQNAVLLLLAVQLMRSGRWLAGHGQPFLSFGGTFYARLTTVFLLTALAPLLSLAYFVTRFSTREFNRELVVTGLNSLQTVRRVAEDYLNLAEPGYGEEIDENVVFWLSRVVRQDINLYRGADLMATSTPELYGSSILNERLDGPVYRALYLEREPFRLAQERVTDLDYETLNAPMRIDRAGAIGVISIPLASQSRAVARKVEELADAILISSCLTVFLLALVGWLVARRVSGPIASLAGAARRVAEGDLDVRVQAPAQDEIGILVESFNRMAGSLREQREALRRRTEYIETILTRAKTGVLSLDAQGTLITINPAAQQLVAPDGPPPTPGDHLPQRLAGATTLRPLLQALQRSLDGSLEGEVAIAIGPAGDERRLRAVFLPFTTAEGAAPGRIVLLEDVTEIVRSGRLAAWAEMARRIAHEVKNPLTPIQLSVEHIRRLWRAQDTQFGKVLAECLDNIQSQVKALRQIATEFSAYSRLPQLHLEPTPIGLLLDEALRPYLTSSPPGISIRKSIAEGLPPLQADRAVLSRALVNLIENALQAMPEGGALEVTAGPAAGLAPGVRIAVSDTGIGIDPAVLPRIFEPYFSTKTGGSGLGLAIARRAVEEHGGTIHIASRPGVGTVVSLNLPTVMVSREGLDVLEEHALRRPVE